MSFVITGDPANHGPQPPVLVFTNGDTFVCVNPTILKTTDAIVFNLQTDATAIASTIPYKTQSVQVDTANSDLLTQIKNPVLVIPNPGKTPVLVV